MRPVPVKVSERTSPDWKKSGEVESTPLFVTALKLGNVAVNGSLGVASDVLFEGARLAALSLLLGGSLLLLAAGTYNPFIYYRF